MWPTNWVFKPVGGNQRFVAFAQRALGALGVGHVSKRQQRRAIGQREQRIVDDALIDTLHLAFKGRALVEECGHRLADTAPDGGIVVQTHASADDFVHMRQLGELAHGDLPDLREGRIVELEPPVGARTPRRLP